MNIYKLISAKIKQKLQTVPELQSVVGSDVWDNVVVEVPKIRDFGDFSTNVAMVLARALKKNPREIANSVLPYIEQIDGIQNVSVAGPGFININIDNSIWEQLVGVILANPDTYGDSFCF